MQIDDSQRKLLAEQTKDICRKLRHKHQVGQKELEYALEIDQSNVSRWENPALDQYPPIYLIAGCLSSDNDKLIKFATDYLDWLETLAGRIAQPLKAKADGSLSDEFSEAAINEGDFAKAIQNSNLEQAETIARKFQEIASRMITEIIEMRKQSKAK